MCFICLKYSGPIAFDDRTRWGAYSAPDPYTGGTSRRGTGKEGREREGKEMGAVSE